MYTFPSFEDVFNSDGYFTGIGHQLIVYGKTLPFVKGSLDKIPPWYQHSLYHHTTTQAGCYVLYERKLNKVYVGSSGDLYRRISNHKGHFVRGQHTNPKIAQLIKTGSKLSDFGLVMIFTHTREEAYDLEQFLLDHFKATGQAVNVSIEDVRNPMRGLIVTEEHRLKISQALRGRKLSQAHRDRMSESLRNNPVQQQRAADLGRSNRKEVSVFGKMYDCVQTAAREIGWSVNSLRKAIRESHPEIRFTTDQVHPHQGKKFNEEHKRKLSLAKSNRHALDRLSQIRPNNSKPLLLNGVLYASVKEAAAKSGIPDVTLREKLRQSGWDKNIVPFVLNYTPKRFLH